MNNLPKCDIIYVVKRITLLIGVTNPSKIVLIGVTNPSKIVLIGVTNPSKIVLIVKKGRHLYGLFI